LGSTQRGQSKLVRELFIWLTDWANTAYVEGPQFDSPLVARTNYNLQGLPPRLIDYLDVVYWQTAESGGYRTDREKQARAVTDYIASLTEKQAIDLHARISGASTASMLDSWFQI
jgi:dGTPase